jgi:nitrate/nitrite transport system permease protein
MTTTEQAIRPAGPALPSRVRRVAGELAERTKTAAIGAIVPLLAFVVFLGLWTLAAHRIVTKYGTLPTPADVWREGGMLLEDHRETRARAKRFEMGREAEAQEQRHYAAIARAKAALVAGGEKQALLARAVQFDTRAEQVAHRRFSASPTYFDQIVTSIKTVFAGFVVASLVAIPIGILCGMSRIFSAAVNPMVQIFKPVSPLAWLPIVMIVVGATYTTDPAEAWFEKSFISSALTVALCSLWPTLVNTAIGVTSIDKDHLNVARVLNLPWATRVRRIVIPSSLPYIFAGLRISLGVGWMVLIAAEMLAQNPGLGKFVWDMFQNGSSQTLARIMVAVFTIGIIGFALDRIMVTLQRVVSYQGVQA